MAAVKQRFVCSGSYKEVSVVESCAFVIQGKAVLNGRASP